MTLLQLGEPVTDGALERVRFFNGRLLTGADLTREQTARDGEESGIARALGSGIASGLEVVRTAADLTEERASVTVRAGLAITSGGRVLSLVSDQRIALVRTDSTDFTAPGGGAFGTCTTPDPGSYVAGEGLYLLTVAPTRVAAGRAQVNGLQGDPLACNVDRDVAGVRFRLIEVRSFRYDGIAPDGPAFRNLLAYRCFGRRVLQSWAASLFAQADSGTTLIDEMTGTELERDEVPLALIAFSGVLDIVFIDQWAVRRDLGSADPAPVLASMVAPGRPRLGRALLQQFQDHLTDLAGSSGLPVGVTAATNFPFLPPLGLLPGMNEAAAKAFLAGRTLRGPVHINAAQFEVLVRESLSAPAIDRDETTVIWLYAVAENLFEGARRLADAARPDPFLVFARGDLAYRGDARFNLHRWNYANFALGGS